MDWLAWVIVGVAVAGVLYAGICVYLARVFTRMPARRWTWPLRATPADRGLPYEDVSFSATDRLRLSGWWLPAGGSTAVVMVHGISFNRLNDNLHFEEAPTSALDLAAALTARGHSVLMYDSRGRGGSEPSRTGYGSIETRDLVGALDWLDERGFAAQDVAVFGSSMGGATAMFTLESRTFAGLVVDSALGGFIVDDVVAYVERKLRVPRWLARGMTTAFMSGVFVAARLLWGMRLREQPADRLRANPVATLVIHCCMDRQVPVRVGEEIAAAAGAQLIGAHYPESLDHLQACSADPEWYIATITDAVGVMFAGRGVVAADAVATA